MSEDFLFMQNSELRVRAPGGATMQHISFEDASTWTSVASFDSSCVVTLTVSQNEPDVDTTQQAEAIVASIDAEIAVARSRVDNYRSLLAFATSYDLMDAIAQSFYQELTNATMQRLRTAALSALPHLNEFVLGCGDLADEHSEALFDVLESLVILGDPAEWTHSDGTPRTLEQMLGPAAQNVLNTARAIMDAAEPDLLEQYKSALQRATEDVLALSVRRTQALEVLRPWIAEIPGTSPESRPARSVGAP